MINGIIYKATNKINGKVYIGKTIQSLNRRIISHGTRSINNTDSSHFHSSIRKYGIASFTWSTLCETDSESKLNALEKFYITAYRKMGILYNLTDGGEGSTGYRHTKETKEKLSESHKGQVPKIKGKPSPLRGIPRSLETRSKISASSKGKILSEETKRKLSEVNRGRKPSQETLEKLRQRIPWNKGKKLTDDHKRKLRENHYKHLSEDHKKNISHGLQKHYQMKRVNICSE